jgi:hypothetical protein
MVLMPVDLEDQALSACSVATWTAIATQAGVEASTLDELLGRLGSKAVGAGNGVKKPWIRGYCGTRIPAAEWSEDTRDILRRWMSPVMSDSDAISLLASRALDAN